MKKTKSLVTTKEQKELVESIVGGLKLTVEQERKLKENLPTWIPEKENVGTAMLQTGQEFLIMLEDILQRHHNFTEKEIIALEKEVKRTLPVLHNMEIKHNLSILSPHDMQAVGEIAQKRYERLDAADKGFYLPTSTDVKRLGGKK